MSATAQSVAARARRPAWAARIGMLAYYALIAALLYDGWLNRDDQLLTAESGMGYALGIIGGAMMLSMLLYSLRKRLRFMRWMGRVKYWFQAHMMLGVLAPTLILYHANFQLGSLNSRVALFCMLTVAGSGLVGRFIYAKIHHGLYGERASVQELSREIEFLHGTIAENTDLSAAVLERLSALEAAVLHRRGGLLATTLRHLAIGGRLRRTRRSVCRQLRESLPRESADAGCRLIREHLTRLRRVSELSVYERLFALWHILHVPLFLMMVVTAIVHVFAVHLY